MKTISEILQESLLDGEKEIEARALNSIGRDMVDNFYGNVKLGGYSSKDILGRDLREGDIVICKHVGCCALGIIEKINGSKCAVYIGVRAVAPAFLSRFRVSPSASQSAVLSGRPRQKAPPFFRAIPPAPLSATPALSSARE